LPFQRLSRTARLCLVALVALVAPVTASAPAQVGTAESSWLLTVRDGALADATATVSAAGGRVVGTLDELSVLEARLPLAALPAVLADPAVLGGREDSLVQVAATGGDRPAPTRNVFRSALRADTAYDAGATGAGVTVALIDTGVADLPQLAPRIVPVKDLDGRTSRCVNFTGEPECGDGYGHGTFLAGLIAGDGTGPTSGTALRGMSDARILDVKIAGAAGSASTSTLLAALQWVVAHEDAYGIGVLNLSLGTPSGASWRVDPLNHAVERAVDAGITVVVSAGNTGPEPRTVTKPGDDPLAITAGASDDRGTPGRGDDKMPRFSAQGPTRADGLAKPDLVAPGARLVGLRSPGSTVERHIPGGVDAAYRRGSGTSMAAAVVSGAAAQLLSARPELTPAEIKAALMSTATPLSGQPVAVTGAGLVDVGAALQWQGPAPVPTPERSSGTGSVVDSSGGLVFALAEPTSLLTAVAADQDRAFDTVSYLADASWTEPGWQTTNWQTTNWQTTNWQTTNWQTTNWQTTNWQTTNWQTTNWQGTTDGDQAGYGRPGSNSANLGAWE
jgi:serine protease AprX